MFYMAFQTPITIKEAVENIHRKKYLLPSIQREVVWCCDQIERLFWNLLGCYYFYYLPTDSTHRPFGK